MVSCITVTKIRRNNYLHHRLYLVSYITNVILSSWEQSNTFYIAISKALKPALRSVYMSPVAQFCDPKYFFSSVEFQVNNNHHLPPQRHWVSHGTTREDKNMHPLCSSSCFRVRVRVETHKSTLVQYAKHTVRKLERGGVSARRASEERRLALARQKHSPRSL